MARSPIAIPHHAVARPSKAGQSLLETLPREILQAILVNLELEDRMPEHRSPYGTVDVNHAALETSTLLSCLLTSRVLYLNGLPITYKSIKISHISKFIHVLRQITSHPILGKHVRCLDLSELRVAHPIREFASSLYGMLCLTPLLMELHIPRDTNTNAFLSESLFQMMFLQMPHLKSLDLTNCTSSTLEHSIPLPHTGQCNAVLPLRSLSLDNCHMIHPATSPFLLSLFPRLTRIQSISLYKSSVTSQALHLIPVTARITKLVVKECPYLDNRPFIDFLASHPAVKYTLETLDASVRPRDYAEAVSEYGEQATRNLLSHMPQTLKTLRLGGWKMGPECIKYLKAFIQTARDLRVGNSLRMCDIEALYLDLDADIPASQNEHDTAESGADANPGYNTVLEPIERAIAICKLRQRCNTVPLPTWINGKPSLNCLDIRSMELVEQSKIRCSILLGEHSAYLNIIVVSEKLIDREGTLRDICASVGWKVKREGRKCLLIRRSS